MSELKATPGPWKIVPYGDGDSLVITEQDDNWRICFMATPGDSPMAWQQIKANACLIVVAPELYKALGDIIANTPIAQLKSKHMQQAIAAYGKVGCQ